MAFTNLLEADVLPASLMASAIAEALSKKAFWCFLILKCLDVL